MPLLEFPLPFLEFPLPMLECKLPDLKAFLPPFQPCLPSFHADHVIVECRVTISNDLDIGSESFCHDIKMTSRRHALRRDLGSYLDLDAFDIGRKILETRV